MIEKIILTLILLYILIILLKVMKKKSKTIFTLKIIEKNFLYIGILILYIVVVIYISHILFL